MKNFLLFTLLSISWTPYAFSRGRTEAIGPFSQEEFVRCTAPGRPVSESPFSYSVFVDSQSVDRNCVNRTQYPIGQCEVSGLLLKKEARSLTPAALVPGRVNLVWNPHGAYFQVNWLSFASGQDIATSALLLRADCSPDGLVGTLTEVDSPAIEMQCRRIEYFSDRDRDGVIDRDDRCPEVAPGFRPDPHRLGCPLSDTDGDGVFDDDDQCLTTPMGERPDPQRLGCPLM